MLRRLLAVYLTTMVALLTCRSARADEPLPKPKGVVVVATEGATDAAWPLARAVYGDEMLRPREIDDAKARVLAGEAASADLSELAELRAGVKGDDAASRQVLAALADKLRVVGIVVVFAGGPQNAMPSARLYDAETKAFDAARYAPEKGEWTGAVKSLERWYLPSPPPLVTVVPKEEAPVVAPKDKPKEKSKSFYESPWFWAAIGAALLIGGGVLIATNVQTSDTIHMQVRLP